MSRRRRRPSRYSKRKKRNTVGETQRRSTGRITMITCEKKSMADGKNKPTDRKKKHTKEK